MLHGTIRKNVEHKVDTNWSDLKKFKVPENVDLLRVVFTMLLKTIVHQLDVELPAAPAPRNFLLGEHDGSVEQES